MQNTLDIPIPHNDEANTVIDFISGLRHHSDNIAAAFDDPVVLTPWQEQIIRTLFGTLDEKGRRRFRTLYFTVAGKNSKSWLASIILVYYLLNVNHNQNIISLAASIKQAELIFQQAAGILHHMGYSDDGEKGVSKPTVTISDFYKTIKNNKNGNKYVVMAPKPQTIDGIVANVVCVDELHRIAHAPEIFSIVAKSLANQAEPLMIVTTTAGYGENTFAFQKYDECKKIISGELEAPSVLPYVYEVPVEDDIYDESNWIKANPALGGEKPFLNIELLRQAADTARRNPVDELMFRRFHMNQFTDAEVSWIGPTQWDACKGTVNEKMLEGQIAYGGMDYAPVNDLSVLVLAIRLEGKYHIITRAWLPEAGLAERCDRDGIDYMKWVASGQLKLTQGDTTNLDTIKNDILLLAKRFQIQRLDVDPFNTVQLSQHLREQGLNVFDHPQTCAQMHYPCLQTQRAIMEKQMIHDGGSLLRYCMMNTVVKLDDGMRMKPDKKKSKGKIDAAIALTMAIGAGELYQEQPALDPDTYFKQKMVWV